jgi:antitoxin PrlF
MKTRVSERGQITIPKKVRERLGIRAGQELEVREQDGMIVAFKAPTTDPLAAVTGIIETDASTDDLIEEIRGQEAAAT